MHLRFPNINFDLTILKYRQKEYKRELLTCGNDKIYAHMASLPALDLDPPSKLLSI